MRNFVIINDFACDISPELREKFQMVESLHGSVHISDGRDFDDVGLNWEHISRTDFYSALSNKRLEISTAPASPERYYESFKSYAAAGYDILSISLSSKISSSFEISVLAANRIKEEFPEIEIYCFDSFRMSAAIGLLSVYAHEMKMQGHSMDEIIEWLEGNKRRVHQMGPIDDLMFVARRGRISTGKAIMGSFAGVKPMGDCSADGYVSVLGKSKGIKKALAATVEYVRLAAQNPEQQYIIVSHSDREEYANQLKAMLESKIKCRGVYITDVYCGCGTNIGPGMVGAYFLGNEITTDSELEKENLRRALEMVK